MEAPDVTLADDVAVSSRFVCVSRDSLVGDEVPIAFDGETEFAADGR
jgi:hypothetical protein